MIQLWYHNRGRELGDKLHFRGKEQKFHHIAIYRDGRVFDFSKGAYYGRWIPAIEAEIPDAIQGTMCYEWRDNWPILENLQMKRISALSLARFYREAQVSDIPSLGNMPWCCLTAAYEILMMSGIDTPLSCITPDRLHEWLSKNSSWMTSAYNQDLSKL